MKTKANKDLFILIFNNGEEYEHYDEWNEGIFLTMESVLLHAANNNTKEIFKIEHWDIKENTLIDYVIYKNGEVICN